MRTIKVQLHPNTVHKLVGEQQELPEGFTVSTRPPGRQGITLEHYVDASETTLEIHLSPDGHWTAFKHVEV